MDIACSSPPITNQDKIHESCPYWKSCQLRDDWTWTGHSWHRWLNSISLIGRKQERSGEHRPFNSRIRLSTHIVVENCHEWQSMYVTMSSGLSLVLQSCHMRLSRGLLGLGSGSEFWGRRRGARRMRCAASVKQLLENAVNKIFDLKFGPQMYLRCLTLLFRQLCLPEKPDICHHIWII